MQPYIVEQTDKTVTVRFKDADMTLIAPIMKVLRDNKDVEVVRLIDKHPELCDKGVFIEVKKGSPLDALKSASKTVSEYYGTLKE
jgi:DNA-directed RNA polymerase subunit L